MENICSEAERNCNSNKSMDAKCNERRLEMFKKDKYMA